jgi:uroporphyrinogen-III synthase
MFIEFLYELRRRKVRVGTQEAIALAEALKAGEVDTVMHFSRRSAENYVSGAKKAGIAGPALALRHLCLSTQVAEPLAGASRIAIASRPDEAALVELLQAQ